jgi:hypothetical protein
VAVAFLAVLAERQDAEILMDVQPTAPIALYRVIVVNMVRNAGFGGFRPGRLVNLSDFSVIAPLRLG